MDPPVGGRLRSVPDEVGDVGSIEPGFDERSRGHSSDKVDYDFPAITTEEAEMSISRPFSEGQVKYFALDVGESDLLEKSR